VTETVLDMRNLRVTYPKLASEVDVVRDCSIQMKKGEILGLVGESGSGKTMTAMSCLGLVPKPGRISGKISVAGHEIVGPEHGQPVRFRGGLSTMIFQNPMTALNPFLNIASQMTDAIVSNRSLSRSEAMDEALAALRAVYIPGPQSTLNKYPHQLSGGQLQRVMIAMAIACKPRLLIADEPTTALDVTIQAQVLILIRELAREMELAVLFITHDLSVVASICDRVAVMYAGEIVETGPVTSVFATAAHPYTRKLFSTVPALGNRGKKLDYIPGQIPDMANLPPGCAFQSRCDAVMDRCRKIRPQLSRLDSKHQASCHLLGSMQ
jgi:peptide/nickel transport system ATP-binding protein